MMRRMIRLAKQLTLSWVANAVALVVVTAVLDGVKADNLGALISAALLFGILNSILKPLLRLLTLPLAVITLGLIWFGVAMLMLKLTAIFVDGFSIHGFGTLVWATIVVWAVNVVLDFVPGPWRGTRRD
jgi:putative membrane protein